MLWQDVLKEAADELLGGDLGSSDLTGSRVLVLEGDLAVIQREDAVVADGNSNDVRGKIFERRLAAADRF